MDHDSNVILYVTGSFVDYSIPYTSDCRLIHNALQLALQKERQEREVNAKKNAEDNH
jgi:hypothetical protein